MSRGSGKVWKRNDVKRGIPCPLCHKSTQWVTRHLRQSHHIQKRDAEHILLTTDYYRRRKSSNPKPKVSCPIDGCIAYVTRLSDHLRRKHKTSQRSLNNIKRNSQLSPAHSSNDGQLVDETSDLPHVSEVVFQIGNTLIDADCAESMISVPQMIGLFGEHMGSFDGGVKATPAAYCLGVRQIMESVGGESLDIACLSKDSVNRLYIEPLLRSNGPRISVKTLRNKLKFLEYFCAFVLVTNNIRKTLSKQCLDNIEALKISLPSWRQSLKNKCTAEEVARRVKDCRDSLSKGDIAKYYASSYATLARQMLLNQSNSFPPTIYDFVKCRNTMS